MNISVPTPRPVRLTPLVDTAKLYKVARQTISYKGMPYVRRVWSLPFMSHGFPWLISPAMIVLSAYQFRLDSGSAPVEGWQTDFFVLWTLFAALSIALLFATSRRAVLGVMVAKVGLFFLLTIPARQSAGVHAALLTSLLLEASLCMSTVGAVVVLATLGVLTPVVYGFFNVLPAKIEVLLAGETTVLSAVPFIVFLLSLSRSSALSGRTAARREADVLDRSVRQLTTANAGFLQYASTVEHATVSKERRRLSRDLHDVVGQTFTNITSMMDAVLRTPIVDGEELRKLHQWIRDHAQWGLQESRRALYRLRSMKELESGGSSALRKLFETFEYATKVKVTVEWRNLPWNLPDETDMTVYRTVQESMVNSFHHGKATEIEISFWSTGRAIQLSVRDNGTGGPVDHAGIGQAGMCERVEALGGRVEFENGAPGYLVRAVIPISSEGSSTS